MYGTSDQPSAAADVARREARAIKWDACGMHELAAAERGAPRRAPGVGGITVPCNRCGGYCYGDCRGDGK